MKKIAALVCAFAAQAAWAAGPFDGIYVSTAEPISFVTVHQNGSGMIAGGFGYVTSNGSVAFTNGSQSFKPALIQEWSAFGGTVEGDTATLTGEGMHGACTVTLEVHFAGDLMTTQVKAAAPTDAGVKQGYQCWSVLPTGAMAQYKRFF